MMPPARSALIACIVILPLGAQLLDENTDMAVPLTAQGKAVRALKIATGPAPVISGIVGAAVDQLDNDPGEWGQGAKGYGRRFISIYGRHSMETMLKAGLDVALKTDPRYDRCTCTGTVPRTAHAIKRVLVTRKDSGGEMINLPLLGAAMSAAIISDQWKPDRLNSTRDHFEVTGIDLAFTGAMNVVREFWPEIKKKIHLRK